MVAPGGRDASVHAVYCIVHEVLIVPFGQWAMLRESLPSDYYPGKVASDSYTALHWNTYLKMHISRYTTNTQQELFIDETGK